MADMKRLTPRIAPISNKADEGGITLETAILMPMFMLFVFFLIYLAQVAVLSMALHGALSQTVRQAATSWYPISLALEQARSVPGAEQAEDWSGKLAGAGEALSRYSRFLPSPVKEWAEMAADGSLSLEQQAARLAFAQALKPFVDGRVLEQSRISVVAVELPDAQGRDKAYLTVEAEYRLPFRIPLLNRPMVLRESARERAWVGGSPSGSKLEEEGEEASLNIVFVSLEPDPVRSGRKATLTLRTDPGATLDLSVLYKSGLSEAKHLGSATADSSGKVSWTWHVSGRTTPGRWQLSVSNADGKKWERAFDVVGKS